MLRREAAYFLAALRFLTRLPVPQRIGHSQEQLDACARYFPLVGWLVGGIGAGATFAVAQLAPFEVAVLLGMAATLLCTGAFHEDGFADACDGFGGGADKARILAIMKDSRLGSYGVIGVAMQLLVKWQSLVALGSLAYGALPAAHALSRLAPVILLHHLDDARAADAARKPRPRRAGAAALVFAALCGLAPILPLGWRAAPALALAGLVTWTAARYLRRRLGGYTGDCLGATQQLAEATFYLGVLCACC